MSSSARCAGPGSDASGLGVPVASPTAVARRLSARPCSVATDWLKTSFRAISSSAANVSRYGSEPEVQAAATSAAASSTSSEAAAA